MKKFLLLTVGMLTLSASLPLVNAQESTTEETSATEMQAEEVSEVQAALEEAISLFQEEHPSAMITEIQIDFPDLDDNDDPEIEIMIDGFDQENEYEMEFEEYELRVVENEVDRDDVDDDDIELPLDTIISLDEAVEIAREEVGAEAHITQIDLDHSDDRNIFYWEVQFELTQSDDDDVEVTIDAEISEVLRVEYDD